MKQLKDTLSMNMAGFSLAELLITFVLVGLLAAFTIPQLFQVPSSKQNTKYTAMAHDVAVMVTSAYERYKVANQGAGPNNQFSDIAGYMNYVKLDTSGTTTYNDPPTGYWLGGNHTCGTDFIGTNYCYALHNGGIVWFNSASHFGVNTVSSTNAIWFNFDPDGSGPADSLQFWLTYPGYVYTVKNLPTTITTGYIFSTSTQVPTTQDASWFSGF
jgi:type II secretory pathway pseudopilin PulG